MTRSEVLESLQKRFGADIVALADKSSKRVYVEIRPDAIVRVARFVFSDLAARFNIATGVDTRSCIEILYHFIVEDINLLITLRVRLGKEDPVIDSLAPHIEATNFIEREIAEMLGVTFRGHPDPRRLLLPDGWPEGVHPLRRDYQEWDKSAVRDRGVQ